MIKTRYQKPGQGMTLSPARKAASFAFQGPRPSSALTPATLEGLLSNLLQRLSHLQEVRTDYPCDYMARCKAGFTDAL
ncbi:hypothetical protein, partial [Marinobacter nauticus]